MHTNIFIHIHVHIYIYIYTYVGANVRSRLLQGISLNDPSLIDQLYAAHKTLIDSNINR
jgi:hypothetical protein